MKRKVLVLAFVIAFFGFGLIIPTSNFESISMQLQDQPNQLEFTPSAISDNTEDFVDQVSNLHAPTDLGTHDVFADFQDYGSNYDAMAEGDTGGAGVNEYRYVDSVTTPTWTTVGSTPYLDAQDQPTNYIHTVTNGLVSDWYEFGETSGTGTGFTVNCSLYWVAATDSSFSWELDWTGDGTADASGGPITTQTTWGWFDLGTISGLDTQTEIDAARIRFTYDKGGGGPDQCSIDASRIGISQPAASNYQLDLEVGWTAADFDETNEELCIYPVTGGGWPTENILVDVWNGAWTNVIADLTPDQWNNVSISSYLTGTTFEIRFLGGTETGDSTQDTWEIDAVLIHTWTPSYTPANDQIPSLDNPSDTDNMYAQYLEYQITVYVSDQNGFADIDYLEIGLWDNTQATEYCRFRYDEDTNTFTEEYDIGTAVSLNTGSSTATASGNDIDATFYFTFDWDFPDSTDLDARCYVIDTQTESATTWYEVNWDVETRLDYSVAPSIDDASGTADRGDLDGTFSLTGTVIYYTSVDDFPSTTSVDVWVSASEYGTTIGPWSDLTLTSGAFDVTCYADDLVGLDTYTIKVVEEAAGSGATDLYYTTSVTDTYIADRVQVQSYSVTDARVNVNDNVDIDVTLYYDYDNSAVTDGTVTVNAAAATHQGAGVWRITDSEATVMANTYDAVAYTGGTHGITTVDQNGQSQQVIWDQVIVVSYTVVDNRVDISTAVNVDVTIQYDYDNTAVTDGTVTVNAISATHQGAGVWRISPSQASVTAVTYNTVASSGNTHGISSVNQNGQSQQVIWDQITVTGYTVSDDRVNINDNVNIDVTIEYAYDNTAVTDGTVTINSLSATHQGAGVWRLTDSEASVMANTYNTVAASGNTEGITSVNQNGQSIAAIWDRISVQTTVVDDGRVGVSTSAEVRVTLWLEYDSTLLGAGDSVTLDGVAMTWDGVNSWFDLSRTQASVGLWVYFVNSTTETAFGITALNLNSQTVSVIWDRAQVQSYSVTDARVNINDNVDVDVTLYYDYDNTAVTDGTVTINGLSATHQGVGVWRATDSKATVQLFTYDTVAASGNTHGISVVDQNTQTQDVIWDRVQVQSYSVSDGRVDLNDNVDIDVTLHYDYDNLAVTDGSVTINGASATHQGVGVWRITDSEAVVMVNTYDTIVASGNANGISTVDQNGQSQLVIWDQITVRSYTVTDTRVNINDAVNIDVTIEYEYDDSAVTDGTVTINGASATHQGAGVWRISDSEATVILNTYDTIVCSGNTYGITSVNQNSQSVDVIWDRIQVQSYLVADTRVNITDSVNIDVTLYYDYDDSAVTDGTVTINGASATHQGAGVWRITDSEVVVMVNTYDTVACSGGIHGISTVDQNGQSQQVIWDQVIVVSYSVADNRVDINTVVNVDVTIQYDYDNSAVTDGTVTINGIAATHQGSGVWRITPSQAAVTGVTYNLVATSGNTHGIVSITQNGQSQLVIWDQVIVTGYAVSDGRVNINANVDIDATIEYAYDNSAVIDGTVTINGASATHQGLGVWRITQAQATVQSVTYNTVVSSGNTEGITSVDQNGQSIAAIWDRISVQTTVVDDGRVGVGSSVEVRVTLWLEYDSTFLGAGDSVTLDGVAMTWDGVNSWFDLSRSQASVGLWVYFVNSSSDATFGITELNLNSQSVSVIWDQVQVQSYFVSDNRVNINDNVDLDVTLVYDYDNTVVTDGTLTINGLSATHQGAGVWRATDSKATVQLFTYDTVVASGNTHGISVVDQNAQTQDVIWDRVQVQSYSVTDARVNLNDNVDVDVTLYYDYDNSAVTDGTVTINGASATHQGAGVWRITDSEATVTSNTYNTVACSLNTLGISTVDQNGQSQQVIWDQITVRSYSVSDARANIGDTVNIDVTIEYEFDDTDVTDGTVTINGFSATHQGLGVWRITDSEASVLLNTYDTVACSANAEGITSVNQNAQSVDVTWDRVQVQSYSVTDARIDISTAAQVDVTLYYDYDNSAVTDGTVTINGVSATHQGAGVWRISDTKATVQLFTYDTVAVSGNTYGLTSVDQNSQTQDVIWDRVQVQSYSVADTRVNINDNVNVDVTIVYDYDNAEVTDGTVTINGLSATHQGGGVWRVTDSKATVQLFTYNSVSASSNTHGITVVDQNSQTQDVIWDRLVIVIGVDSPAPLNGVQANFTLTATYDYDDVASTTYQLVIDRNSTWWHSFTNTNKSLFVDTNSDTTYNYVVRLITSESTYGILAFTTNTQQVIWAAAPNIAPTNDAGPVLSNPDDTDNMYARYRYYIITSTVTDTNGYADIDYVELSLYDDAQAGAVWTVRYTVAGDSFSIPLGGAYIDLHATSYATPSGNSITITWIIKIDWDHSDLTDIDTRQYVDDGTLSDDDYYESNWDVETRLDVTGLTLDDGSGTADRGDLDGSFTIAGTLIYFGSVDDNPLSNETDVWVSVSEYGTNIGPWSDLTLTTGQFSLTVYADDAVGQDTYTVKAVAEGAGAGGTDLLGTSAQDTYIADRIQVQSYSVADSRVNIDDSVNIDVTLYYEYDSSQVTDGTVTVNGLTATHQSLGVWRVSDVESAVMANTYNAVVYSVGTHGLTGVNQNGQSQTVIWDQIVVQTTVADDTRVNVSDNVEIRVTLWLDYDNTFLGSGDSVTLGGVAMTWDAVNFWFDVSVSQASVGLWKNFVNSSSDATYGITALSLAGLDVDVIWDQVLVQGYSVSDARVNLDDSVNIDVTLVYSYDSTAVTDGTVTINGLSTIHQGAGVWRATDSQSTLQLVTYDTIVALGNTYGLSSVDQNTQTQDVIWDRIQVQSYSVSDDRVTVNANVNLDVTLVYDYDNSAVTDGSVTINGASATHQAAGVWRAIVSESTVVANTYNLVACSGNTHGISTVDQNAQSQQVIWDQITVRGYSVLDNRVNVGSAVEVNVTVEYEYDDTPVVDGTLTINGMFASHQGGGIWQISDTEATVMQNLYQTVMCASNAHGISSVNQDSQNQIVIWDRVQVMSYSVLDTRVNVNDNVDLDVTIRYAWDIAPVTDGTVTINGVSATHQGGGVWRITDSKATVQLFTYDTVACSGNTHGISVVDQNSQTQDVIWDQVQVQNYSVLDSRINISDNVDLNVTLVYAYDSTAVTDGSVSINTLPAAHLGSGVWQITVTTGSVELRTYDTVTCSGNSLGITSVDQNGQSQNVIWDRVQVQSYSVLDARVNINDNVDINVTLFYDYDNSAVTDGTVTIMGISATHIENGIWQITETEATVTANTYLTVVVSGNTYGIITVDQNGQSQQIIWDQITVRSYSVTDTRISIGDSVNIDVTIEYEYDDTAVTDGTVTINGLSATHQGAGIWRVVDSEASVVLNTYNLVACSANAEGITSVNQNAQTVDIIWDRVQVQSYSVSDGRVGLNDNVNIDVTIVYDYDNAAVTDGTVTINGLTATHQGAGVWRATDSEASVMTNTYNTVACSGNAFGISAVDQNGQSTTAIWDQLVVTIGVDDSTPLNTIQANFTLAIIFDYDDVACTTYQIVVYRNGTWWHSFTDANKSLFVDTNSDSLYTYTVQVVTSESTYNVLAFSTNSQQVVWSPSPNNAPINDAAPVLTNPDDTDNMYARYVYYIITSNVSDGNGYSDINYVELTLYDDSRASPVWTVRYTISGRTFSIELGSEYIDLHVTSFAIESGNDIDITWIIKIDWDHSDLTDVDTRQYVRDGIIGVEDFYESNWDVETRLDITGLTIDDGSGTSSRGPLDGAITVSGTVIFLGSVDDYPLSNETDVWVSSSEYGTSIGPWSDLTLTSGQFSLTVYADDQVGQDTLSIIVVIEAAGSGGADLLDTPIQSTYIADRIQVQVYSASDPRVDIGDTVTIDVELYYEYDSTAVTDGAVTISGISATHQGSGTWRFSDMKSSVQLVTYDTVVYNDGTHGLNQVNQNAMSQDVIWDQIVVQTTVADYTRVNVVAIVEVRVTLWLAYDSTFLGSGDSVTLNGLSMTWDFGNSWFELTVSQATVGLWTYFVNSSSEATYGITDMDTNSQSVDVVWDQIVVQTTVVDDSRLDVSSDAEIRVTLMLAYDSTYLGAADSVTLDGSAMTWDAGNSWFELTVNQASVGAWTYFVNSTTDSTYGITSFDVNSQQVQVIWDELVVQTTLADDIRVNMGANVEIRVTVWLAYDSTFLGAADTVTLDGAAMTWDGANSWFDLTVSQVSVSLWSYFVNSSVDSTYGITVLDLNSQSVDVIWDRIVVQSTVVDDARVDVNANAEIRVTLMLEYDSTFLGVADSVTLDGTAMTWDAGNSWFELTVSQASVGAWTYFVNSSSDATYSIDLLDLSGNSVGVIWDRVQVQSYSIIDDRVNVGDSVDIDVTLLYDYDDTQVVDGTITVNGIAATHQGAGVWRFTDSEVSVVMNTYNLAVSSGNAHGLTVVDQNAQSLDVIWDQLVIVIGVDDASSLNGHQANFTLTVTYDYDDAVCTTYQVAIDRNATWWHSFIDANVSLFVDTNADITYLYNASLVTSETTYGITVFTTNTLQVVWSLAPNELPINDSSPVLTNGDDTDYLYARYRYYVITTSASDPDGYGDLSYVELTLYSDDQLTQYWTIRYTVGTGMFSVESGGSIVVVGAMSTAVGAGYNLTINWHIKIGWAHADIVDSDILQFVTDGPATDSDFYETNWNVETRLDYSVTPSLSDDRGDVNTADLVATGSVTYYGSGLNPLSNETDVWVLHDLVGTWNGDLTAGSFSISSIGSAAVVRLNTYTVKIVAEGDGSGGTDLYYTTSPTDTFITDGIEIYLAEVIDGRIDVNSDCEVWWRARYLYDSAEIQSGLTITLNGSRTLAWDAGGLYWRWQETSVTPASSGFEVSSASESTFGLTYWVNTTSVQQVIWDSLIITMTDPVDQRIDVGANATGILVSAVYAFDGSVFDGTFTLNNTNFVYAVTQMQGYTVLSVSGDTFGIAAIQTNDATFCIWDRVMVVSVGADELYHDPDDNVVVTVELQYEYDGSSVIAGTFAITTYPLTHVGSGVWEAQVTISTYLAIDFDDLTTCDATLYGISEYNMDNNAVTVYWDRLEFYSVSVDDSRINVGASAEVQWSVRLETAGISITAGVTAQMTGPIALTPAAGVFSATVTESAVGSVTYSILTASLGEIGLFIQSASDATVIWDQVLVTSIIATPLSTDTNTATEVRVTLVFEFDSTPVTTGQVNLDDNGVSLPMSYNSAGGYWSASVTKNIAGNYTFAVEYVLGNTHDITALDTDSLSVEVEWVGAPGFVIDTMTLMIIGGGAGIGVLGLAIVASRRRRGGVVADLTALEPDDFRVVEPVEVEAIPEGIESEEIEPEIEPEVVEEPEVSEPDVEVVEEAVEPEVEVIEEVPEPEEIESLVDEELVIEPEPEVIEEPIIEPEIEPEGVDYDDIPDEFIEPKAPVDLSTLTKKELLGMIPKDILETSSPNELKRLTKQELISLIESFQD